MGYGTFKSKEKNMKYIGQWDEDKMVGEGVCEFDNGEKYVG